MERPRGRPRPVRGPLPEAEAVGYGKPPKASRFKPGQSGNPAGRRKGVRNNVTLYKKVLETKVRATITDQARDMPILEAVLLKRAAKALAGDNRAADWMLETAEALEAREVALAEQKVITERQRQIMERWEAEIAERLAAPTGRRS